MIDFVKSFNEGLTSANIVQNNIDEIGSVFIELNNQLNSATGGKVQIYIAGSGSVIAACNPLLKKDNSKRLGQWSQHPKGYPCKITIGNTEYVCEDKEALELALANMLQDPSVGESLKTLLSLTPEQIDEERK